MTFAAYASESKCVAGRRPIDAEPFNTWREPCGNRAAVVVVVPVNHSDMLLRLCMDHVREFDRHHSHPENR